MQPDHPGCRSGHTITAVGDNCQLLYGGLVPRSEGAETCSNDLYKLDSSSLAWRKVAACGGTPQRCFAHCAVVVGREAKSLAVFAGMLCAGHISRQLSILDDVTSDSPSWEVVPVTGCWPAARFGHSGARIPSTGDMLIFGGVTEGNVFLNDVWTFSLENRKWKCVETSGQAPCPRRRHTATVEGNTMYVFGGRGMENQHYNDLHALDLTTFAWKKLSFAHGPRPDSRMGHAAVVIDGVLVVYGGSSPQPCADTGYFLHSDAFALPLHAPTLKWEVLQRSLPAFTMSAAFANKKTMYVYGGRDTKQCLSHFFHITLPKTLEQHSMPKPPAKLELKNTGDDATSLFSEVPYTGMPSLEESPFSKFAKSRMKRQMVTKEGQPPRALSVLDSSTTNAMNRSKVEPRALIF
eukprot:Sspe_Gene.97986::Locus_71471_Transcript_1_1_Confidence_1.000_Length_1427::g.97986::m.97986